jgi:hypothetical protein
LYREAARSLRRVISSAALTLEAYAVLIGLDAIPGLSTGAQMPAGSEHARDRVPAVGPGVLANLDADADGEIAGT